VASVIKGLIVRVPIPGGALLLRQSDRAGLPKTRLRLGSDPVIGFPNPRGPLRPAAAPM